MKGFYINFVLASAEDKATLWKNLESKKEKIKSVDIRHKFINIITE